MNEASEYQFDDNTSDDWANNDSFDSVPDNGADSNETVTEIQTQIQALAASEGFRYSFFSPEEINRLLAEEHIDMAALAATPANVEELLADPLPADSVPFWLDYLKTGVVQDYLGTDDETRKELEAYVEGKIPSSRSVLENNCYRPNKGAVAYSTLSYLPFLAEHMAESGKISLESSELLERIVDNLDNSLRTREIEYLNPTEEVSFTPDEQRNFFYVAVAGVKKSGVFQVSIFHRRSLDGEKITDEQKEKGALLEAEFDEVVNSVKDPNKSLSEAVTLFDTYLESLFARDIIGPKRLAEFKHKIRVLTQTVYRYLPTQEKTKVVLQLKVAASTALQLLCGGQVPDENIDFICGGYKKSQISFEE